MRVLVLSDSVFIPTSMEYYTGLSASGGHQLPTHLFYLKEPNASDYPRQLAHRMGIERFDVYVDFVKEEFPGKRAILAELHSEGLSEAYRIEEGGEVCASILSPTASPLIVLSTEEGNRGFNRRYAYWKHLFADRHAGASYYFGSNY